MITAAVSSILGIVGGLVPEAVGYFKSKQEFQQEMQMMEAQKNIQIELAEHKLNERMLTLEGELAIADIQTQGRQMEKIHENQSQLTGIRWVDALNSALRPATAVMVMVMFFTIASMFGYAVITQVIQGGIDLEEAAVVLWGSMIGEAIQAVLGFLFTYRATIKRGKIFS